MFFYLSPMPMDGSLKRKNRRVNILFHLSVLALAIVLDLPNAFDFRSLIYYVVTRVFPLGVFYVCYFWLVPYYLAKRRIVAFAVWLFIVLNTIVPIGYFTLEVVSAVNLGEPIRLFYRLNMHFSGLFTVVVAAIFGIAFRSITAWYLEMHNRSIVQQEKLKNELMLLKAQINPHFLFNTLNSIDYLIYSNQSKASESLIKLSSLMRYVIYDTVDDLVTLQKELEQMEVYVDLQKMRFGEIDSVLYEVQGNPSGRMIAPMLFIPFIENAFKHIDEVAIKKGIEIRFRIDDNSVEFTCRNYISHKESKQRGGFGLENVKKRLEMQYPNSYGLTINQTAEEYIVALKINL